MSATDSFYFRLDHNVQNMVDMHLDAHIYRSLHKPVQDGLGSEVLRKVPRIPPDQTADFLMTACNFNIIRIMGGLGGFPVMA